MLKTVDNGTKKAIKIILFFLGIIIFGVALGFLYVHAENTVSFSFDDRDPSISYTSVSRYFLRDAYQGTVSRIPYQGSATFTIYGDELYIYGCPSTNSAVASVYVDGFIVGYTNNIGTSAALGDPQLVFLKLDLGSGPHLVSIVGSSQYSSGTQSGYFYLDRYEALTDGRTTDIFQNYVLVLLSVLLIFNILTFAIRFVYWRLTHRND